MELSLMCQDFYTTLRFTNEKKEEEKTISTSVFDQVGKVNGLTSTITVAKSNLLGLTCYTLYYYDYQAYLQDDVRLTYQYAECHSRSYPLLAQFNIMHDIGADILIDRQIQIREHECRFLVTNIILCFGRNICCTNR